MSFSLTIFSPNKNITSNTEETETRFILYTCYNYRKGKGDAKHLIKSIQLISEEFVCYTRICHPERSEGSLEF